MHVTEEQMPDAVAMRADDLGEGRPLRKRDTVHRVHANRERGVVHEEVDGPVRRRLGEGTRSPCKALLAHLPSMTLLVKRVEKEQSAARGIAPALYKTVRITRRRGEHVKARGTTVMVAHQDNVGQAQTVHAVEEVPIRAHLSPMRQIASDDGKRRVGVVPVDVGDSRIEPSLGVETVKPEARFDQVRVGDVDKFHA